MVDNYIVDRLRSLASYLKLGKPLSPATQEEALREAADEITRLRAEVATVYARGIEDAAKVADRRAAVCGELASADNIERHASLEASHIAKAIRALAEQAPHFQTLQRIYTPEHVKPLVEALRKYGRHHADCAVVGGYDYGCICGFDEALKQFAYEPEEG